MSGSNREAGSRSRRAVRRRVAASLGAATVALTLATPASAAQPRNPACLGEDVRSYARGGVGAFGFENFGSFVSGVLAADGVGGEIQAHLAGAIPDDMMPNTCND